MADLLLLLLVMGALVLLPDRTAATVDWYGFLLRPALLDGILTVFEKDIFGFFNRDRYSQNPKRARALKPEFRPKISFSARKAVGSPWWRLCRRWCCWRSSIHVLSTVY